MSRLMGLVFVVLLALVSVGGFVYLSLQIKAGEAQIAAGADQLVAGRAELDSGKTRLAEGKKEFRQAERSAVKDWLRGDGGKEKQSEEAQLRGLIQGARDYRDAREQIAEGQRKIALGERRVDEGAQKLRQGQEQLQFTKRARWVAGSAAGLFSVLSIVLALFVALKE